MRNIKKILLVILSSVLCVVTLAACFKKDSSDVREEISSSDKSLTVSVAELNMIIGDELTVSVDYSEKQGVTLEFSSSNADVATVNKEGKINAVGKGATEINVKYGEENAKINVTVGFGDLVPTLVFEHVESGSFNLTVGDGINLKPTVTFNGKSFIPDKTTYKQTDASVADISDDGNVTAKAKGATEITVECEWQGQKFSTLAKRFTVNAINKIDLLLNGSGDFSDKTLYTLAYFGGNTFDTSIPFDVKAYMNDTEITPTITIIEGEEYLYYSDKDKTVSVSEAKETGTAVVKIEINAFNETYSKEIKVIIKPCFGTYTEEVLDFSLADGDIPVGKIFGEEVSLLYAEYADGRLIEVTDNKLTGMAVEKNDLGKDLTLRVYAKGCGYEITVKPYTKVIKTSADLAYFELKDVTKMQGKSIKSSTVFDGYYILADNIDAASYEHRVVKDATYNAILNNSVDASGNSTKNVDKADYHKGEVKTNDERAIYGGLTGVFDGNGHTISNLTVVDQGLFGLIASGIVKNVAFKNVTLKASAYQKNICLFAQYVSNGRFENVYVSANPIYGGEQQKTQTSDARGNRALVAIWVDGFYNLIEGQNNFAPTEFINCVFDYKIENTKIQYCYSYGLYAAESSYYGGNDGKSSPKFNNVYVIANTPISVRNDSLVVKNANTKVILAENEASETRTKLAVALNYMSGCFFNKTDSENTLNDNYVKVAGRLKSDEVGVRQYATVAEMKSANNDYASFDPSFWSLADNIVSFK